MKRLAKGFTIIEVMIVLAIAGLIMIIVFLAVPELERNVRDTGRKTIADNMMAELQNYASRHEGTYPFYDGGDPRTIVWARFGDFYNNYIRGYVNDKDPKTGDSVFGDGYGADPALDDAETCIDIGPSIPAGTPCTYTEFAPYYVIPGKIQIYVNATCDGSIPVSNGVNLYQRNSAVFVVVMGLERPGTYYCIGS